MKKGQIVEGNVYRVDFPNKGRVWIEDEGDVIVKNVLPGQRVSVRVKKKRKGKAEGELLEVLKPAENQLNTPKCPHFGECGGCIYQNLSYEDQLELKEKQIKRLLTEVMKAEQHCTGEASCGVSPCPMKKNAIEDVWHPIFH